MGLDIQPLPLRYKLCYGLFISLQDRSLSLSLHLYVYCVNNPVLYYDYSENEAAIIQWWKAATKEDDVDLLLFLLIYISSRTGGKIGASLDTMTSTILYSIILTLQKQGGKIIETQISFGHIYCGYYLVLIFLLVDRAA